MSNNRLPYQQLQQSHISHSLVLCDEDRLEVVHRLITAMQRSETRIVLFVVVQFDDTGEVVVVPDKDKFVRMFDTLRPGPLRPLEMDDFSIAMLDAGEEAYQECSRLIDFLVNTHQGWYLAVRDVEAVLKRPRNAWKRFANMFESYGKNFREYRLIVDLRKTLDITRAPLISQERAQLFAARRPAVGPVKAEAADDTTVEYSSSIFSRHSRADLAASAASSSSTSSSEDQVLSSEARRFREEAEKKPGVVGSTSSLSSSTTKATRVIRVPHLSRNSSSTKL